MIIETNSLVDRYQKALDFYVNILVAKHNDNLFTTKNEDKKFFLTQKERLVLSYYLLQGFNSDTIEALVQMKIGKKHQIYNINYRLRNCGYLIDSKEGKGLAKGMKTLKKAIESNCEFPIKIQ